MSFTANDVKILREATGAGMMDCKNALQETGGDIEKATLFLREKGLAAAAKKAGRIAAEGMVCATVCNDCSCGNGAIVEINSETDFAAKADKFVEFVNAVADVIAKECPKDLAALEALPYPDSGMTVAEMLSENVQVIGENLKIRRFVCNCGNGVNVAYNHMGGRIGVLINLSVSDNLKGNDAVVELGRNVAMQTAAMNPLWLRSQDADPAVVENEKNIIMTQIVEEGKPQHVAEKIVEGRIQKYFSEVCLLNQLYVKGDKITVQQYIDETAKTLGGEIVLNSFVRYEKGEGLEKKEDNFADEVSKMVQ
ncbi:MAG: translation elongation factor Ts [Oscillospiraceae bacterium]|nr:translation elongation factor Ts [Oscillospiraceae bacterium]